MKRRGHQGVVLLAAAWIIETVALSRPVLAILAILGLWYLEPLPDKDHQVEWLEHRKTSHSLLAVGVVGAIVGGLGWLVGRYAVEPVVGALFTTSASAGGSGLSWWAARLIALDVSTLREAGLVIGAGAIVVHLLGDVITTGGLQRFLPFSRWKLRFSSLSYDNRVANNGLFALGVLAVVASLVSVLRTIGGVWSIPRVGVRRSVMLLTVPGGHDGQYQEQQPSRSRRAFGAFACSLAVSPM